MIPNLAKEMESARSYLSPNLRQRRSRSDIPFPVNDVLRGWFLSFLNGLLAVPFGLFELLRYISNSFKRVTDASGYVTEIWRERTQPELWLYILGQLGFIALPLLVFVAFHDAAWTWRALACPVSFAVLIVVTLVLPIGSRRRYTRLIARRETGHERLFLGLMTPDLLLSASGEGLKACLLEALGYLLVIILGAAITQMTLYGIAPAEFSVGEGAQLPSFGIALFLEFLFMSVASMLTSEYAALAPEGLLAQSVAAVELVLGSFYLIAIFPTLVAMSVEKRPATALLGSKAALRPDAIDAILTGARNWLVEQQVDGRYWRSVLPADVVATGIAAAFLDLCGEIPGSADMAGNLRAAAAEMNTRPARDPAGHAALLISNDAFNEAELALTLKRMRRVRQTDENQPMLVALMALACGRVNLDCAAASIPEDLEVWDQVYGSHWGCYALLTRLIVAQLESDGTLSAGALTDETSAHCNELLRRRSDNGSWFEDVLLTSLVGVVFNRLGLFSVPMAETANWTIAEARRRVGGLAIIFGLPVWDTAWSVRALQSLIPDDEIPRRGLNWLVRHANVSGIEGEWSWSTGLAMGCFDTTSLVCEALHSAQLKDVRIASSLDAGLARLRSVGVGHQYPTFLGCDGEPIHFCPIISARVVSLLQRHEGQTRPEAETILDDVANGWISEWFSDPAITQGLVLSYLGPFCIPSLRSAKALARSLAANPPASIEGAGASLLGLVSALRNLHLAIDVRKRCESRIRDLVDYLVARRSDHHWSGDLTGMFGFGRRYGDPIFATALALQALSTQQ